MTLLDIITWLLGIPVGLCAVFFFAGPDIRLAHDCHGADCRRGGVG